SRILTDNHPGCCSRAASQCSFHLSGSSVLGSRRGQAYRMMAATWGGGANSPVAATGNLDDFSKGCAGTNSLIRHDIIRGIDIFLPISEYIVIISFNETTSGENS